MSGFYCSKCKRTFRSQIGFNSTEHECVHPKKDEAEPKFDRRAPSDMKRVRDCPPSYASRNRDDAVYDAFAPGLQIDFTSPPPPPDTSSGGGDFGGGGASGSW